MRLFFIAPAALLMASGVATAQTVVDSAGGRVEVIGLHHWSLSMLQDSFALKAPGETLQSHACAAILQLKLGFPSAAVATYMTGPMSRGAPSTGKMLTVITVVEPQDSARVRYLAAAPDSLATPTPWRDLDQAVRDSSQWDLNGLLFVMQFYSGAGTALDSAVSAIARLDKAHVPLARRLLPALRAHATPGDRALAMRVLANDRALRNRALAIAVLANFDSDDATWHALVRELRDPEERVRAVAQSVIQSFSWRHPRKIDWRPSTDDLRALVGGTNAWAFVGVAQMLVRTGASPDLASALLANNFDLVLAHARAQSAEPRAPVIALLTQLHGGLLTDGADWERWLRSL